MSNPYNPQVPQPPVPGNQFGPPPAVPLATADQRRYALSTAVGNEVNRGGRVESQNEVSAIVVHGKNPNHVLHLVLTLVTCGMWSVVWIALAFTQKEHRSQLFVDEFGQIQVQRFS